MTPSKKPKSAKELYEKLVSDDVMDEESEEDDENDQGKNLLFLLVFFKDRVFYGKVWLTKLILKYAFWLFRLYLLVRMFKLAIEFGLTALVFID